LKQAGGIYRRASLFQPMESGAISQRADVHNLEVMQAIPEVLETGGISIHHFQLMAAAAKILLHHFTRPFSRRDRMLSESNPGPNAATDRIMDDRSKC
jgi:hypothetical protein